MKILSLLIACKREEPRALASRSIHRINYSSRQLILRNFWQQLCELGPSESISKLRNGKRIFIFVRPSKKRNSSANEQTNSILAVTLMGLQKCSPGSLHYSSRCKLVAAFCRIPRGLHSLYFLCTDAGRGRIARFHLAAHERVDIVSL